MATCNTGHQELATVLSTGLTVVLVISFVSQHYKIISRRLSLGFSPWFLLLGATSSTGALLDIYTLQWGVVKCCRHVSAGVCMASLGGIIQVSLQWILFNITFVLVLLYFPSERKFTTMDGSPRRETARFDHRSVAGATKSTDWRNMKICVWLTAVHFVLSLLYTVAIVHFEFGPNYPTPRVAQWSKFLGISSALLSILQYLPQLWRTWQIGLVGSLSIPMMCFEVPGATVMVTSIALREGTDWTNWAMYAASGAMAGLLLLLCLAWKVRQARLGVDDFGRPLNKPIDTPNPSETAPLLTGDVRAA